MSVLSSAYVQLKERRKKNIFIVLLNTWNWFDCGHDNNALISDIAWPWNRFISCFQYSAGCVLGSMWRKVAISRSCNVIVQHVIQHAIVNIQEHSTDYSQMCYVSREIHTRQCCCTVCIPTLVVTVTLPVSMMLESTQKFEKIDKFSKCQLK